MNNEYILKMLSILEHKDVIKSLNKKGYIISVNKLSNYEFIKKQIDIILKDNYTLIGNKINELVTKLIDFLEDSKVSYYLNSKKIMAYSLIKIDIDYVLNKLFSNFSFEIIKDKVFLSKKFNSEKEVNLFLDSLSSKKDNIQELFKKFNLKYMLVFNLSYDKFKKQFIMDCSSNEKINSYVLTECIDDNLIDFSNDTLILGVVANDDWKIKKASIIESKPFLLDSIYTNFSDIKVKLCDFRGNFIDEFGEMLLNIGYNLRENENIEETKPNNHLNAINAENKTQNNSFIDEHKILNKELHCLEEAYNYYISNKTSPTVHINADLTKDIKTHDIDYINKIKVNAASDYNDFLLKLESYNDFNFKINIINEKINCYYNEVIPF